MKLSKTKFIHYINSKHLDNFEKTYRHIEDEREISDDDLFALLELEKNAKKKIITETMSSILKESSDDESFEIDEKALIKLDPQLEIMMPYYEKIEALSERKISNIFGGEVSYSKDTFNQKYFQIHKDDYDFFAFLDAYQEDDDTIRIIETKATTSRKFVDLIFKDDSKEKQPVFMKSPEGIYMLREEFGYDVNKNYHKQLEKLYKREKGPGKYVYDLAYQRYIVDRADKKTKSKKYYLSVLNSDYVFDGHYDQKGEPIYTDDIMVLIDLTKITEIYQTQLEEDTSRVINKLNHMDLEAIKLEESLMLGQNLVRAKYEELIGIDYPITEYYMSHLGFSDGLNKYTEEEVVKQGILNLDDLPESWLERKNQQIQFQAYKNNKPYIDKQRLKDVIDYLKYPLYHLDFETFPCPLPRFKGESPYEQSVFQFSLHIEEKPGECDKDKNHYEFLAPDHKDYREEIARLLSTYIKDDDGFVVAYNVSFEKMIIKKLAKLYPKYREKLLSLVDRAFDLMDILKGNSRLFEELGYEKEIIFNFYDKKQHGSYSIKKVLPVLSDLSYEGLPVANGTEALVTYAKFPRTREENINQYEKDYNDLLAYCKQDTWAMFVILNKLRRLVDFHSI